jgi:hypothetical protein
LFFSFMESNWWMLLICHLALPLFLFWNRVLLYNPDWPQIWNPLASISWLLGLPPISPFLAHI